MQRGAETVKRINTWIERKVDELFGLDLRSLALARVALAIIVLLDLMIRLPMMRMHYGDYGIFPTAAFKNDWYEPGLWSLTYVNGSTWITVIVFVFCALFASMLLIGWHTRIAAIGTWFTMYSIQSANPIILQGGDMYLHILLFLGIFVPWGKYFSVDSALTYKEPPRRMFTFWTAAYTIQVAYVYFFAYYAKTSPIWHVDGTAVYYALQIDQLVTPFGHFMSNQYGLLMFLTFGVITLQHMAAYLIFSPYHTVVTRTVAITLLAGMHLSFAIHMHLGPFSWISIAGLAPLLPTRFWEMLWRWSIRYNFGSLQIYYDGGCGFCKKSVFLFRTFLLLPKSTIAPAQENALALEEMQRKDSWVIVDRNGVMHTEYDAFVALLRASPIAFFLAPLFSFSFCRRIGNRVYRFVANHRSKTCAPDMDMPLPLWKWRAQFTLMILSSLFALFYIGYTVTWNASKASAFNQYIQVPEKIKFIGPLFGWQQHWAMFAPYPYTDDGWLILLAKKSDGTEIDLMRGGPPFHGTAPVSYEKPRVVADLYPNERIRKYSMNMGHGDFTRFRKYLTDYLCRSLNEGKTGGEQIEEVQIIYMLERTAPEYQPVVPVKQVLETKACPLPPPVASPE